jgi:hypothetical protein
MYKPNHFSNATERQQRRDAHLACSPIIRQAYRRESYRMERSPSQYWFVVLVLFVITYVVFTHVR